MKKIVLFLVIVLSFVALIGGYMKREGEKRRQAEVARREALAQEQAAKVAEARAEKERQEAEKARREEMAREREKKRALYAQKQEEARARKAKEKQEADRKAQEDAHAERGKLCEKLLSTLKNAPLHPWRELAEKDDPEKATGDRTFYCVFPDGVGGRMFLELKTMFGRPVSLRRLDSASNTEQYEPSEFHQLASVFPNLLVVGDSVYFRASQSDVDLCRIPEKNRGFNPAEQDFGALYEIVRGLGLRTDAFQYEVYLRPSGTTNDVPVAKVAFGENVQQEAFREKFQQWTRKMSKSSARANQQWKKQKKRTVVFSDKTVIGKRIDGTIEVPRTFVFYGNKHKYLEDSPEYLREVKKEELAKAKWQRLFDEAKRQESGGASATGTKEDAFADSSVVYKLAPSR